MQSEGSGRWVPCVYFSYFELAFLGLACGSLPQDAIILYENVFEPLKHLDTIHAGSLVKPDCRDHVAEIQGPVPGTLTTRRGYCL